MEYIGLEMLDFCYVFSAQFKNKSDLITSPQNIYFFIFVL